MQSKVIHFYTFFPTTPNLSTTTDDICSASFYPVLLQIFLPEQVNLERQWEIAISDISYPSMHQNKIEGKISFFDEKLSKSTTTYNVEPGLYTSITDFAQPMNTLIQERNNHNGTCITVKVSRRTKKVVNMLANDTSGLAFCSTEFGHFFGNNVGN